MITTTPLWLWLILYLVIVNAMTSALFAWDKLCAMEQRWRVPESSLLIWSFLGGSLGAKISQQVFRHKTHKQPFGRNLNGIVVFQVLVVVSAGIISVLPGGPDAARRIADAAFESVIGPIDRGSQPGRIAPRRFGPGS